jgi:hypothetical protein
MPQSRINETYEYNENIWIISVVNTTGSIVAGHTAIVVEGLEKMDGIYEKPFIGQYDIAANAEEESCINVKGYITKIKCFENEENKRDYAKEKYPALSYYVEPIKAKEMIRSVKEDALKTKQAMTIGSYVDLLRYQKLGKNHLLTQLLGDPLNGDNCTGWCLEKLAIAGVGNGNGKPKPFWQAGQCIFL